MGLARHTEGSLCMPGVMAFCMMPLIAASAVADREAPLVLSNQHLAVLFSRDRHGSIAQIEDLKTGLRLIPTELAPLYEVSFERYPEDPLWISSAEAAATQFDVDPSRLRLVVRNSHTQPLACTVVLSVEVARNAPTAHFGIDIQNENGLSLSQVRFPFAPVTDAIAGDDDAVYLLMPRGEGLLYPNGRFAFRQGTGIESPGAASLQLIAAYGDRGGVLLRTEDTAGWRKILTMRPSGNNGEGFLAVEHRAAYQPGASCEVPYRTAVTLFHGNWRAAAADYGGWAHEQKWCARQIHQRDDFPDVLKAGAAGVSIKDRLTEPPLGQYTLMANRFHELLGTSRIPILFRPYDWANAAEWYGPEYFPVIGGSERFSSDCAELAKHNAVVYPFMNAGLWLYEARYGTADVARRAWRKSDRYDGWAFFTRHGMPFIALTREQFFRHEPFQKAQDGKAPMCLACGGYRDLVVDNYVRIVRLGAIGCHFDGNIGGGPPICYSDKHGHPPGCGNWGVRGYLEVMKRVRQGAQAIRQGFISGTEEPGELAIADTHLYHSNPGQAQTSFPYGWSCQVLNARPVPLYLAVYHAYQVSLDRWPYLGKDSDEIRHGLGLTLVWGKQINCHFVRRALPDPLPPCARLYREAVRMRALVAPKYLIFGEMLNEPVVECKRVTLRVPRTQPRGRAQGEMTWTEPAVLAWGWKAPDGRRSYVLVNWTLDEQGFDLAIAEGEEQDPVSVSMRSDLGETLAAENVRLPYHVLGTLPPCKAVLYEVH